MNSLLKTLSFINNHQIGKRNLIKSYRNFFSWQIGQFISPGFKKMSFVEDTFLIANKGMTGATGNLYVGLHEFEDMAFLLHFLREGDYFIDIGANIGSYTILAAGLSKANCISIEPAGDTFMHLKKNIELNKLEKRVKLINKGLSSTEGELNFSIGHDSVNHVLTKEDKSKFVRIETTTLNSLISTNPCPSLIKIDVEGFEGEVLKGGAEVLQNPDLKAIIIELNNSGLAYGYSDNNLDEIIRSFGFLSYSYSPFDRQLLETEIHKTPNVIYIRDYDVVCDRVKSSRKFKVLDSIF